jgi:hypothetical protein
MDEHESKGKSTTDMSIEESHRNLVFSVIRIGC